MKSLVAAVSFAAVLLLAAACGDDPQPEGTPAPTATTAPIEGPTAGPSLAATPGVLARGQIVFTSDRDGNVEIYVMNADGSDQTNLTNNPANDRFPSWSPVP